MQVELRNLNLGWWYPEGNQQDPNKRHMERIHEFDCFPECRTGRSKDDTVAGLKVLHIGIQPVGEDAKMAVFLWRASIQEMMCSTSEAADSSPGHLNCAGTPDPQGGRHMEHHSRHSRGVMLRC